MTLKNANAKNWALPARSNGRRYSDPANAPAASAVTLASPTMTSDGASVAFSGGAYTTLIPQWSTDQTNWNSLSSDTTTPFTFTGVTAGSALRYFRALSDGTVASNVVSGYLTPTVPTITASRINDTTIRFTLSGGLNASTWTANYRTPAGSGTYTSASLTVGQATYDVTVSSQSTADFYPTVANAGGSVDGSVVTGSAASTDSYGITTYAAQKLISSQDMTVNTGGSGNNVQWITNESEPFARINYVTAFTFGLRWSFVDRNQPQFYARFKIRRSSNSCSKMFKCLGQRFNGGADYSNTTFGPSIFGYTGTGIGIQWDDGISGANDNGIGYNMAGSMAGGTTSGSFSRAQPTVTGSSNYNISAAGTTWVEFEIFTKFNSDNTADGEVIIWIDGVLKFHATSVYNCVNGGQARDVIGLGEYSSSSGFSEDYKQFSISYERPVGRGV